MDTELTAIESENLPACDPHKGFRIGQRVSVGGFFWIGRVIGHDSDARHGHGIDDRSGGSVDTDCTLTIRGFEGDNAVVRLDRPETPYGAPAAIGTVFLMPLETMSAWPEMIKARVERENERHHLANKYCR